MDFSKIKKISFILLILFILLFPFWCVRGLCAEEETVDVSYVSSLNMSLDRNYFVSGTTTIAYFPIEKGYIYHIYNNSVYNLLCAFSYDIPANNVTYNDPFLLANQQSYSFISDSVDYLFIDVTNNSNLSVTREKVTSMNGAVSSLVDNVGINSVWNIFDISINYIVVVVLFAFGCYIIFRIIRKISRGKEGL